MALDRRDAPDRLPDGLPLGQAVACRSASGGRPGTRHRPAQRGRSRADVHSVRCRRRPGRGGAVAAAALDRRAAEPIRGRHGRRRQQQLGGGAVSHRHRPAVAGRQPASPARDAEPVFADTHRLRRVRRDRPHRCRRARFPALRPHADGRLVRDTRLHGHPRPVYRAVRRRRDPCPQRRRVAAGDAPAGTHQGARRSRMSRWSPSTRIMAR